MSKDSSNNYAKEVARFFFEEYSHEERKEIFMGMDADEREELMVVLALDHPAKLERFKERIKKESKELDDEVRRIEEELDDDFGDE